MIGNPKWRPGLQARVKRRIERRAAAPKPDAAATPHDKLLWAAKTGRLGTLVARTRPRQPPAWVTPEEREAERVEVPSSRVATDTPAVEPSETEGPPLPEPEPTPNEAFIAEHCRWVPLAERSSHRPRHHIEGRVMTEYDPLTGEIIGDGYRHDDDEDEDEEW